MTTMQSSVCGRLLQRSTSPDHALGYHRAESAQLHANANSAFAASGPDITAAAIMSMSTVASTVTFAVFGVIIIVYISFVALRDFDF